MRRKKKTRSKRGRLKAAPTSLEKSVIDYDAILESVENKFLLGKSFLDPEVRRASSISTGTLVLDLLIGNGGIIPGCWLTVLGKESSAKSTNIMQMMLAAVISEVPLRLFYDYEGSSSDPAYLENMFLCKLNNLSARDLFGVKDEKGRWVIKPRIHYYGEDIAEKFFDSVKALLKTLPDKVYLNNKWWLRYEDDKVGKAAIGVKFDKRMKKQYKGLYVPAPNPYMQAVILVDSYPAMLPGKMDEREEGGGGIGEKARMFSENLSKVKPKLRRKQVTILGVNQLRDKPMVMFGSPEYEPGGNALKFISDVRFKFTPRVIPKWFDSKAKGEFQEEIDITGENVDKYRFIHIRNIKNKTATPYLEGWMRLWVQNAKGKGCGIDPVFDMFEFLRMTGQIEGKYKNMTLTMGNLVIKNLDWMHLKRLVLYRGKRLKKLCRILKLKKPINLRKRALLQLKNGTADTLMFATMNEKRKKEKDTVNE